MSPDPKDLAKLLEADEAEAEKPEVETEVETEAEIKESPPEPVEEKPAKTVKVKKVEKVSPEKILAPKLPKDVKLLPGLELGDSVAPPNGFTDAYKLRGTLQFIGGRKHDSAEKMIALGAKGGKWMFIVRTELHFTCKDLRFSSTQTDEWLQSL